MAGTSVSFEWINSPKVLKIPGGRLVSMILFAIMAFIRMLLARDRPNVIIGSTAHPFAALAAELAARWYNVPFIYEVRDIWPLSAIAFGRAKAGSLSTWLIDRLDRNLCLRAVKIISVLPNYRLFCEENDRDGSKVVIIPNGVDISSIPPSNPADKSNLTLMHVGSLGQANGLEAIFDGLSLLNKNGAPENLRVEFIGAGPLRAEFEQRAKHEGLDFIHFIDPMPKTELAIHMTRADGFILSIAPQPQLYRYGVAMNKMSDYLAVGRPVFLVSDLTDTHAHLAGAAITVRPDQPDEFSYAVMAFGQMSTEQRDAMGENARRYAEQNLSYEKLSVKLVETLNLVLDDSN